MKQDQNCYQMLVRAVFKEPSMAVLRLHEPCMCLHESFKEIVWQNKADQIKLAFPMIVQGTHSKLQFPLPKYPFSQKFTPLPPLVSSVGGGKVTFLADFHVNFLPGNQFSRVKKRQCFLCLIPKGFVRAICYTWSEQHRVGIQR